MNRRVANEQIYWLCEWITVARVLTVDDEPEVLNYLTLLFEDAGHQTVGASDGKSGLREFFASRPDVAVVDVMMPDMDGVELCRRINP